MNKIVSLFLLSFCCAVMGQDNFSLDEYERIIKQANEEKEHIKGLHKTDEMHKIYIDEPKEEASIIIDNRLKNEDSLKQSQDKVPNENKVTDENIQMESAEKEKDLPDNQAGVTEQNRKKKEVKTVKSKNKNLKKSYRYIPPSSKSSSGTRPINFQTNKSSTRKKILFGIPIGTEFKVKLDKTASNIQTGYIKICSKNDVEGEKKTMEAGTCFFGTPSANRATSKLFVSLRKGRTSDSIEFNLRADVYDVSGAPGLVANIQSDGRTSDRSIAQGKKAIGEAILGRLNNNTDVGNIASSAAGEALNESNEIARERAGDGGLIVVAPPQEAIVIVGETF